MKFETDYIEKLAKIIADNELTEISLEDGDQAITIRKDIPEIAMAAPMTAPSSFSAPVAAPAPVSQTEAKTEPAAHKGKAITSPMVGTFYAAPSPDADAFVEVGKSISQGDVVCIIEAMKLMNQIESEYSGTITEICVKDGQPVEYGQPLMYIE